MSNRVKKYIKIIVITIAAISLAWFLYYIATINPSLNRSQDIRKLREALKITLESKEIDMKYSDELIDIIERSEDSLGWHNLPTYENKVHIDFYNKSNEIMYSLTFYPDEYDIGFNKKREKKILEKDRKRFLEILNYIDNENNSYESNSSEDDEECCEGCMCGDTIELLKTTETAWFLTKVNSKGEYEHIKDSFINFHGTGKNKFAFFKKNDEVKGNFSINEKNEIILVPNDDKNNIVTCKLGEEKDLIAIMNCDNDFGTFTLQKEGTLELPSIIKSTISKTKTIKVKGQQYNNKKYTKKITKEKEINVLLSVINGSKVWTGAVTLPSPQYELNLYDSNKKRIAKILYNPDNYFTIKINDKSYELTNIDKDLMYIILKK